MIEYMYVHIGKNICIDSNKIICILNLETIKNTNEFKESIKKEEKNIIDISDGNKKTIILTKEKDGMKYYITSILSGTLEKRTKIL